jgi:CDP-diglyceride synthetase
VLNPYGSTDTRLLGNVVVAVLFVVAVASGHPFWLVCATLLIAVVVSGEALRWKRARRAGDRSWRLLRADSR